MARGKTKAAGSTAIRKRSGARSRSAGSVAEVESKPYVHSTHTVAARPEIGTEPQFRKRKPPRTYRYDSSLSPALEWDGQNPAREQGEAALRAILDLDTSAIMDAPDLATAKKAALDILAKAKASAAALKSLSKPFLNWAGKAERLSFDVPTLPLFVHERLSTSAIIESVRGHKIKASNAQADFYSLFGDPDRSITDQVLRAYEHPDKWVNRMILGDSLVVMNSLLEYESLGGQVQMIYIDPPYGVKFGSNFQPFVRKRDVKHNDDEDFTREPEMVQAYRDTWELGLHSYLAYLRDRLLLARQMLTPRGSIFVQISDENLHHMRELMDEVFGAENFVSVITFKKTTSATSELLSAVSDYLLWYARDRERVKYRQLHQTKHIGGEGADQYTWLELADGTRRRALDTEFENPPLGAKFFRPDQLTSQRPPGDFPVEFEGNTIRPARGYWKTGPEGMENLKAARRIMRVGNTLCYVRYISDFPAFPIANLWDDTVTSGFSEPKRYVVQTHPLVIQRCIQMTTDPGDLVLDPTCGSGTTAYVAEQWGRRWITIDTSRVPLALARQKLLTATFPWYRLNDENSGPVSGFVYVRKQNRKGEETGGIVPHITLKSIANNEPSAEEVLVDRPEAVNEVVRVAGPFSVEASIPTPMDLDANAQHEAVAQPAEYGFYVDRMLDVLRRSPVIRLDGGATVTLKSIRLPAKSLNLSAEAVVDATSAGKPTLADAVCSADERNKGMLPLTDKIVGIVFGPESGAVSERLVQEAAREAYMKGYSHLFVIGFAIHPNARQFIDHCSAIAGITADYVQMTPDVVMGDLLKTTRASQIFSVAGRPDVVLRKAASGKSSDEPRFEVELRGVDTFDPTTMKPASRKGDDVPAWMLDSDYNGRVFRATQVFFPRTSAWDALKKALKATHEDSVWDHLAGTRSAPFEKGVHDEVAVKVIDDRGNELLVVKRLSEADSA